MNNLDKELGKPLPEKDYAANCQIFCDKYPYIVLTNFINGIDFYALAHLIGWFCKAIMFRDFKLCWFLSISFEVMEITFRHWLSNFWECWWDQLILDIFGCNAVSIWLGGLTINYFNIKKFEWISTKNDESDKSNNNSSLNSISHDNDAIVSTNTNKWLLFSSFRNFAYFIWLNVFFHALTLSNFFLKFILFIPASHLILTLRLCIWFPIGAAATREYYADFTNESASTLEPFFWLAHFILFIEWSIVYKFSSGFFIEEFPQSVVYFWGGVFLLIGSVSVYLLIKDYKNGHKKIQK